MSVTKQCTTCGKPVERPSYEAKTIPNAFCNRKCYSEWRKTLTGESSPRWKGGLATLICEQCQKSYQRKVKDTKRQNCRFCSRKCFAQWKSEHMRGKNNFHWQGGEIDEEYYGPEWPGIREAIRQRDNYTCQRCGVHQEDYFRALDVHHIISLREFLPDRIEEAHAFSNLITLCSSCHRTIHNGIELELSTVAF